MGVEIKASALASTTEAFNQVLTPAFKTKATAEAISAQVSTVGSTGDSTLASIEATAAVGVASTTVVSAPRAFW